MFMKNKDQILQEIERTMQSLDGTRRAEANPFLFTRIQARMQPQGWWEKVTSYISRPVIALAILAVVLSVNILSVSFDPGKAANAAVEIDQATSGDINNEYMASADKYDTQILNNQ
jgi:hypothetical protein